MMGGGGGGGRFQTLLMLLQDMRPKDLQTVQRPGSLYSIK